VIDSQPPSTASTDTDRHYVEVTYNSESSSHSCRRHVHPGNWIPPATSIRFQSNLEECRSWKKAIICTWIDPCWHAALQFPPVASLASIYHRLLRGDFSHSRYLVDQSHARTRIPRNTIY